MRREKLLSCRLLRPALNINLSFQERAFLNRNPDRRDIAIHYGGLSQFHPVAGLHIPVEFALDDHSLGLNRGFYLAMRPHRQTIVFEGDAALHLTVDIKVFATR